MESRAAIYRLSRLDMKYRRNSKARKGFTLIELLVVIAIIGVLAGLVMVNMAGVRERARDTQRKSELNEVKKALRLYYNDNSRYPASLDLTINTAFTHPTNPSMVYMKARPNDPLMDAVTKLPHYTYYQTGCTSGTDDFRLVAILENASDPDIVKSETRCGSGCGFTFDAGSNHFVVCPD